MTNAHQIDASLETPSGKSADTENFPVGRAIRPDLRPHVHAFYRFARAADDIADNPLMEPAEKLNRLRQFAAALTDDSLDLPAVTPLRNSLRETGVSPQHSLDLLTAFMRDAVKRRYTDWADLMEYCRYSASPVGRHVLALHGIGEAAWPANDALCSALQVINHLQDCADDYMEMDRVYLPLDDFAAAGIAPESLSAEKSSPALRQILDLQIERLTPLLQEARLLPKAVPDFRLKCETAVISALADRLTILLQKRDPLAGPVKLGRFGKICAALRGLVRAVVGV
jgi:hydroxysqualene synthase